jgi:hypothetical protein
MLGKEESHVYLVLITAVQQQVEWNNYFTKC